MRARRHRVAALVPDILRGLRAAVATVVPFFLAGQLGRPELAWVALGGWLGSLADPGGTRGRRATAMAAFAVLAGATVAIASSAADVPWLAGAILVAIAFAASLARALGGTAITMGGVLVVTAAVSVSTSNAADPLLDGAGFALGATWALVLSTVVWPVWTHLPVRRATGAVLAALASYAEAIAAAADARADADVWNAIAREHQRAVRGALEAARAMAVELRARRTGETRVGANVRVLLGEAEQQLFALIAVATEAEAEAAISLDELRAAAAAYRDAALALDTPRLGAMRETRADAEVEGLARAAAELRSIARDLDREPGERVELEAPAAPRPSAWQAIHDALSPRSPVLRHAIRVACTAAVAFAVGRWLSPAHVGWVSVTALAVLQPFPGATITRAVERVVGTVLGSALAVGIMMTIRSPLVLALLMIPLSVAAVVTRPRSYRLFVVFLTPVFLLVATHWQADWHVAAARITDAAAGGVIAFIAAAIVAPAWEHRRLPDVLAAVYAALARHEAISLDVLAGRPHAPAEIAAARRGVGVALDEAEASLERMLAEPRRVQHGVDEAVFVVTYARRLATALTTAALRAPGLDADGLAAARARIARDAEILATARAPRDAAEGTLGVRA